MNAGRWLLITVVAAAAITTGVMLFQDDKTPTEAVTANETAAAKSATDDAVVEQATAQPTQDPTVREAVATDSTPASPTDPTAAAGPSHSITGRVVDEAGRPVAGADVEALAFGIGRIGKGASTTTDPSGKFTLVYKGDSDLTDRLRVRGKQHADAFVTLGSKGGDSDVGTIVVESGGSVMGRVLDKSGNPVAKATVSAYVKDRKSGGSDGLFVLGDLDQARTRTATTDPSGAWRIDGLPAGQVSVNADADGYAPETVRDVQIEKLKVTPDLVLNLDKGLSISGVVLDASGRPLAGADVSVSREVIDLTEGGMGATFGRDLVRKTDANGRFAMEGLRDEGYTVNVRAPGFVDRSVERVVAGTADMRVSMKASGVVFGVVTDAVTKKPVTNYEVEPTNSMFGFGVMRGNALRVLHGAEAARIAGVAEEPGLFAIGDLTTESMTLGVKADGYAPMTMSGIATPSGQKSRMDFTLTPEITVSGIVRAPDGTPVEGAIVTIERVSDDEGGFALPGGGRARVARRSIRIEDDGSGPTVVNDSPPRTATTDAKGEYTIRGLAAGDHSIHATHATHAGSERKPVALEDGDQLDGLDLSLRAGGALEGIAYDQYGKPLANANVALSAPDQGGVNFGGASIQSFGSYGDERASATSDEDGHYAMSGILPGDYVVRVSKPRSAVGGGAVFIAVAGGGDSDAGVPVTIREGETVAQDVSLPPTGDVVGTVTESGRPVANARVTLSRGGEGLPFGEPSATTDADGKYDIRDVKPGGYSLVVKAPKSAVPHKTKVRVDPKRETTEHVKLPSGAIRGRIVEEDTNKPLEGIVVDVRPAKSGEGDESDTEVREVRMIAMVSNDGGATTMKFGNETENVVTDSDGYYEVRFLAPGEYRMEIRGGGIMKMGKDRVLVPEGGAAEGIDFRAARGATLSVTADLGPSTESEEDGNGPMMFVETTVSPVDDPGSEDTQAEIGSRPTTFEGLKPGQYSVRVKVGNKKGEVVVSIESGERKTVKVPVQ
ncbi:MAG: carboxypeptidase regulatory-like domain-containing protein [Planctomycetes bacterium]|nr:carboxypeptidase regulatory-like domain-containing protein [Planctomycetota bacterium]